jgi:hypothetical protein
MNITREKNKITIEVEEIDCRWGQTTEMMADAVMCGMRVTLLHPDLHNKALSSISSNPALEEAADRATRDFKERWEIP